MTTPQQYLAIGTVASAVIEAVMAAGEDVGTPGGVLYAAMMAQGCSLHQFTSLMNALVVSSRLKKDGECYRATAEGRRFVLTHKALVLAHNALVAAHAPKASA